MNILYKIDDLLIDKFFQPIADKIQDIFGYNNFRVGEFLYQLACVALIVNTMFTDKVGSVLKTIIVIICLLGIGLSKFRLTVAERTIKPGMANIYRLKDRVFRILFLIYGLFAFYFQIFEFSDNSMGDYFFTAIFWPSLVSQGYFYACNPKPPSTSKVREKWNKFLTNLNDWLVDERDRAPAPLGS